MRLFLCLLFLVSDILLTSRSYQGFLYVCLFPGFAFRPASWEQTISPYQGKGENATERKLPIDVGRTRRELHYKTTQNS